MAVTYSIHHPTADLAGSKQSIPVLPVKAAGQRSLALDTASAAIAGPCELRILPDEDVWFDCKAASADLNAATSTLKLFGGGEYYFRLGRGNHFIIASAS